MTYGLEYTSGLGSNPLAITGKPALSLYATHSILCTLNGKSYRWGSVTVTGPVANYIAVSGLGQYYAVIAEPQSGGGYKVTVKIPQASTDQSVIVYVLTDNDTHISASDYGMAIYSDAGLLQFSSNAGYPRVVDMVYIDPALGAQNINFSNPLNETPYCAYMGINHNGFIMYGLGQPMVEAFLKFNSNTQLAFTMLQTGIGTSLFGYTFANYITIFVM